VYRAETAVGCAVAKVTKSVIHVVLRKQHHLTLLNSKTVNGMMDGILTLMAY
jgi:hypothetical protein